MPLSPTSGKSLNKGQTQKYGGGGSVYATVGLFCFDQFEDKQTRKCSTFFPNAIVN